MQQKQSYISFSEKVRRNQTLNAKATNCFTPWIIATYKDIQLDPQIHIKLDFLVAKH